MLIVSLEGDIQNSNIICSQQFEAVGFLKVVCGIIVSVVHLWSGFFNEKSQKFAGNHRFFFSDLLLKTKIP